MKKIVKWLGIGLIVLVLLLLVAVGAIYALSSSRINASYTVQVQPVNIPTGAAAIERGQHLAETRGCMDCHGQNLAGGPFIDDPAIGRIYAANLTAGNGGIADFTDIDWVRAIRHGVGPDNKPLLFMPSQEFYYLSDADLGDLIAYLKSVPPVDGPEPDSSPGPLGRVLFLAGEFPLVPAELIDHDAPRPSAPSPGVTVEYGQYLAVGCTGCHGTGFSGGPIPGVPPEWPPAANLTPSGELATWTEVDFITTMRSGVTPDGRELNSDFMPWPTISRLTDDELKALWLFLQQLPAKEAGTR